MPTTIGSYLTTSITLASAGLIAVAPMAPTAPGTLTMTLRLATNKTAVVDSANHLAGLAVGGSGIPIPQLYGTYVQNANDLFIQRILPGADSEAVFTPEGASPVFSGIQSLPIDTSIAQGRFMLDIYVTQNGGGGNTVSVYGESQSAMISSLVMGDLQQAGVPADAVKFVPVGNVDDPDGGWGARFDESFPAFTTTFNMSTPADTPYDTSIYIQEYDGFSNFPKYPLHVLLDLNAILGLQFVHPEYRDLPQQELDDAIKLPTSADYHGNTAYHMIPMSDSPHRYIPLVVPLTISPLIGKPLADLLQPVLTQIVNLGYDNPDNNGWDVGHADVPTGFGVFPALRSARSGWRPARRSRSLWWWAASTPSWASPRSTTSSATSACQASRSDPAGSQAREALPDRFGGQPVVAERITVLRRAWSLLAGREIGVHRAARRTGELQTEIPVDAGDGSHRVGDEVSVVDVAELSGIVTGPFGVEQLQSARPGLHLVGADLRADEGAGVARGGVLGQ